MTSVLSCSALSIHVPLGPPLPEELHLSACGTGMNEFRHLAGQYMIARVLERGLMKRSGGERRNDLDKGVSSHLLEGRGSGALERMSIASLKAFAP